MVKKYDWYPGDDVKVTPKRRTPKAPKLRAGVEPGRVLILLSGRFRGKRVVCLKQLKSGLLCVTGPYKVNGVPVKRVNQVYTLTTSAKVDLKGVKTDAITDETFKKEAAKKSTRSQKFFAENAPKSTTSDARKKLQKDVDGALAAALKSDKMLAKYLGARFSLTKSDAPHAMKF
jgi:large subunit ribosomal protein L6e|tara:strand:+ start:365 stop:886 length:522 start_codon:yes stop_codon:yes gene_type:complete